MDWKVILDNNGASIFRSTTNPAKFGTGYADDGRPLEIYNTATGRTVLSGAITLFGNIRLEDDRLRVGCQRIPLGWVLAAGRKHRCLNRLISRKQLNALRKGSILTKSLDKKLR